MLVGKQEAERLRQAVPAWKSWVTHTSICHTLLWHLAGIFCCLWACLKSFSPPHTRSQMSNWVPLPIWLPQDLWSNLTATPMSKESRVFLCSALLHQAVLHRRDGFADPPWMRVFLKLLGQPNNLQQGNLAPLRPHPALAPQLDWLWC